MWIINLQGQNPSTISSSTSRGKKINRVVLCRLHTDKKEYSSEEEEVKPAAKKPVAAANEKSAVTDCSVKFNDRCEFPEILDLSSYIQTRSRETQLTPASTCFTLF
jgi:hypothetical protein